MDRTDGPIHSLPAMLELVESPSKAGRGQYVDTEKTALELNPRQLAIRYSDVLPDKIRSYLRRTKVWSGFRIQTATGVITLPREDCSEACFEIAHAMKLAGASPAEALAVTMNTAFWKDRVRRGKREDPARFISKVFDRTWSSMRASSPKLVSVSPTQWAGQPVPKREWLVQDLAPIKKVTLLYGDGGTGKTLLAMQLAVCVVCGRDFLGRPTRTGRVYAFLGEDEEDDTHMTLDSVCRHYEVKLGDLGAMRLTSRASFNNIILHFQQNRPETTPLFAELLADIKAHAPILVILDTAADLFGGNENDRAQVRFFIASCCQRIALETGAAVLLCAHPSVEGLKSGKGTSGSTAWSNTARSRLYLYRVIDEHDTEKDPDFRWLELKKTNHARVRQLIGLRWQAGSFAVEEQHVDSVSARSRTEQQVIEEVETAFENERPWSAHVQAKGRWLGRWLSNKERMNRRPAQKLIDDLISRGAIVEVDYDSHRHRSGLCTPKQKDDLLRAKQAR